MILATELGQAGALLGEDSLGWKSGNTVCLDLGVRHRRGDPTIVSDMDEAGWVGRYSAANPSIAPAGEELIQAQMPIRPHESTDQAALRLERLVDVALADWRARETWRRRQVMDGRSGALDMPGATWRDRPAIDRGDGVFLAGDMVAAPGMLGEVCWASAVEASRLGAERGKLERAATARGCLRRRRETAQDAVTGVSRLARGTRGPRSIVTTKEGGAIAEVVLEDPVGEAAVLERARPPGDRRLGIIRARMCWLPSIQRYLRSWRSEKAP